MITDRAGTRWRRTLVAVCGLLVAGMGLFALLGWILNFPAWASLWSETIPMAPSTALLFVMIGVGVALRARGSRANRLEKWAILVGVLVTLVGLGLAVTSSMGIFLQAEQLGIPILSTPAKWPVGHMAPLTAILFVAAGASFLASLRWFAGGRRLAKVSWWLACALLAAGLALILAYLFGVEGLTIIPRLPPAGLTSAAFLVLGISLLALGGLADGGSGGASGVPQTSFGVFLMIFGLLAVGVITVAYLSYRNYEDRYQEGIGRQLQAVWQLKADELADWRGERLGDAQVLYQNGAFSDLVQRVLDVPGDAESRRQLTTWLAKYPNVYAYERVILLDARGIERLAVPAAGEPTGPHLIQAALGAMRSRGITFLDLHRYDVTDRVHLALLVPIFAAQEGSRSIGVLILDINPETYLYPFLNQWPTPSETAETLLVRREGDQVIFLNELRFRQDAALNLRFPLTEADLPAAAAARGESGLMEGVDYRGAPVIAYVGSVPESPWALVARMDLDEVTAPMRARLRGTIGVVVAMLFGALAGIGLVWRQQRVQYYQARFETERERAWLQDVIARSLNEIYVFDPETLNFIFANTGACRNIGYNLAELVELTPLDIKPTYTRADFEAMLRPLRSGERGLLVFETVHRRKNGSEYPVEVHLQLVRTGERSYFLAIIADITERKRAETDLRESKERLQATMDTMLEGAQIVGYDWRYLYVNDAAAAHGRKPKAEMLGRTMMEAFPGIDQTELFTTLRRCMDQRVARHLQNEFTYPDGTTRDFNLSVQPVPEGLFILSEDNTEERRAEAEERRHARHLEALNQVSRIVSRSLDLDEVYDGFVNELRRLLPVDRTSITRIDEAGERWSIVRQWTTVVPTMKAGHSGLLAGSAFGEVAASRRPLVESPIDPDDRWKESPLLRAEGMQSRIILPMLIKDQVTGTVSFASRVSGAFSAADLDLVVPMVAHLALAVENVRLYTAEREYAAGLELRVRERTAELERANRELEAFAYSVSHDLRAPLRAMQGFSTALLSHFQDQMDEKGRHYLERIQQASQRMGQLINDMLNLSRITRADLNAQPVDLSLLAQQIAAELMARDPERQVEFVIADQLTVEGDAHLLRIALENLIDNAWKFTGTRPKAVIEVGRMTPDEFESLGGDWAAHIGIPERPHPSTTVYYVRDNGVGFDMAYAERLFAPFQRLHAMHEFPGTGIGLAIVQRVVARHNGLIWAHARLEHGATFWFTLGSDR